MPLMRLLGFCAGGTVIGLGVYSCIQSQAIENIVTSIYRIVFGLLIIMSELRLTFLLHWFSFLTFFGGLGGEYLR